MILTFFFAPVLGNSGLLDELREAILLHSSPSVLEKAKPPRVAELDAQLQPDELAALDDAEGGDEFSFSRSVHVGGGKKFYIYGDETMDYYKARDFCQLRAQLLVEPHNKLEEEAMNFLMSTANLGDAWIGLWDVKGEGDWKWPSGHQSTYRNWHPGQPDNWKNLQDCAVLVTWSSGQQKWDDIPCWAKKPVICMDPRGGSKKRTFGPRHTNTPYRRQFVTFDRTQRDWQETRTFCLGQGMTLPEPYNNDDRHHMLSQMKENGFHHVHIGLKMVTRGRWVFDSASEGNYRTFPSSDHSDGNGGQHCAEMNQEGEMTDTDCTGRKHYTICMKDAPFKSAVDLRSGREYMLFDDVLRTKSEAERFCGHRGATLPTLCKAEENSAMLKVVEGHDNWAWLSLKEDKWRVEFEWNPPIDNCQYRNWRLNEPNNKGGAEDGVVLRTTKGGWSDVNTDWFKALTVCMR